MTMTLNCYLGATMETDEPVYRGFLLLPPTGKLIKKKDKRYCLLYKRSSSGVGRLETYENESMTGQPKIFTLEDVIKITPKHGNVINIITKNSDIDYGTMPGETLDNWFQAFKSVAFPDETTFFNGIEQDNDLYCPAEEGVFPVKVLGSDAAERCNLANKSFTLVITASALQLRNEKKKLLYTWPFSYIRKYGYNKSGQFTFEAGRKCASGEGLFYLENPNHEDIYKCLFARMKSMKKLLNAESMSSLIDSSDMLQVASFMEPGSRNPLPPSMSTRSSFRESTQALICSSSESLFPLKTIPKKPPRKTLPFCKNAPTVNLDIGTEYVYFPQKYDTVESRKDAWKTMGVEIPLHSEAVPPADSEPVYCSWGDAPTTPLRQSKKVPNKSIENLTESIYEIDLTEKTTAPTVIPEDLQLEGLDASYDHLNFFGQSSVITSSDYKQVITPTSGNKSQLDLDLYEEVNVMEAARSADDSHLGYAMIKKNNSNNAYEECENDRVAHQLKNQQLYAVISKPKRV
ncbi:unnamed protein product [Ceutorhynchus assimilis]|uniref:IRS-type PTB domain-containing protein n=1 Tax=Ceutorhynchus assimilis TaxID=467358 RepID=A0A9N9MN64_9CUCU|nr:unnamed protein product [Ceutorhynchus assimilis]